MAVSSGDEEEEYEYEEVEVEEEVEDDDEEEEEYEEIVEEVEEEEPEEEPEEEEEEIEEVDDGVVEEEEEEEEYEEVEVTDDENTDEVEAGGGGEIGGDEMQEAASVVAAVMVEAAALEEENTMALENVVADVEENAMAVKEEVTDVEEKATSEQKVVVVETVTEVEEEAKDISDVRSSDLPVTIADQLLNDVKQDGQSEEKEVCNTANSEVVTSLDIHPAEGVRSMKGSPSPSQQNKKGKELLSMEGGRSSLSDILNYTADVPKLGDDTVEYKQGLVEISPPAGPIKDEKIHDKYTTPVATSEKHVSTPDGILDKLHNHETMDIDETRLPSQKVDLHPSSENMDRKALRYTPQIRPRNMSPEAECESVSKRSAMVCEYFAKGWCIKGSSCRFLHKREQEDHARGHVEGDVLSKAEILPSKGSGDAACSSKSLAQSQPKCFMTNSDDMLPTSSGGRYFDHRECVNDNENFHVHERDFLHPRPSVSSQRSPSSINGSKVVSRQIESDVDMFKGSRLSGDLDHHNNSSVPFSRSTLMDNFPTGNGFLPRGVVPYAMLEESVAMRRQYTLDLHSSPIRGFSSKSNSYLGNASLLDDSSLKDLLISYKNKRKFTPFNWEPSVPFRHSHFITSFTTLSSNVQYDPLRDSIDQSDIRHGSFRRSSYGQTQGLAYQHAQSISCRNSVESHKRLHSDSNYKDFYNNDKNVHVVEAESAAISATDAGNKNTSDKGNAGVTASVKDVLKATKSITDENSNLKIDDSRHNRDTGRTNELDEEESKAIRIFRAALIEFVKELMKPVWHEGRLSKDIYKIIVQKAEDKILSTLPSNEVPHTPESIKQYLSSSRPNILRLIQAYVEKYGKF